jgi:hypothetical protein
MPPVDELRMDAGEVQIRYGDIQGQPYYRIKSASGFSYHPAFGLTSSNGLMLISSEDRLAVEHLAG